MRACTKCNETKDLVDFATVSRLKTGKGSRCKDCHTAASNARAKAMPKTVNAYKAKWKATVRGRASTLCEVARVNAKRCGVACTITNEWVARKLAQGVCELSGLKPTLLNETEHYRCPRSSSLDRIDPKGPYTENNVRVVCWQVNLFRGEYSDADMYELVEALYVNRTISSQASKEEGSTAIPQGSRGKRPEVHTALN